MAEVTFEVTQEDIDNSGHSIHDCMLATMFNRYFKQEVTVFCKALQGAKLTHSHIRLGPSLIQYFLPSKAVLMANKYEASANNTMFYNDTTIELKPFSFTMDVERHLLK